MALYVQTWPYDAEAYWLQVGAAGRERIEGAPHPAFAAVQELIDTKSRSLILLSSRDELVLLATGLPSPRRTRQAPRVTNSVLAICDHTREAEIRALARGLLDVAAERRDGEVDARIEAHMKMGETGTTFDVSPHLLEMWPLGPLADPPDATTPARSDAAPIAFGQPGAPRVGRNTPARRSEIADWLRRPLEDWHLEERLVPTVAITGLQSPEVLVHAGARWVLTDMVETELWPSEPGHESAPGPARFPPPNAPAAMRSASPRPVQRLIEMLRRVVLALRP